MALIETIKQLLDNKHVSSKDDKLIFTPKFYKDLAEEYKSVNFNTPSKGVENNQVAVKVYDDFPITTKLNTYQYGDWVEFYSRFISDAKIPAYIEVKFGNSYPANKYSEDGMKAFQKAIKDGHDYRILVVAVGMYYKSKVQYKKAIGSYMASGEWRTDYKSLLEEASNGNLEKYLQNETDSTGSFTLG